MEQPILNTPTERYRDEVIAKFNEAIDEKAFTLEGGEHDGVQVIRVSDTRFPWEVEIPEPSAHAAEVRTPARVVVSAKCPICGERGTMSVFIEAVAEVETSGRTLKLKAKSKAISHVCGQTTFEPEVNGQEALPDFNIDDITRAAQAVVDNDPSVADGGDEGDEPDEDETPPLAICAWPGCDLSDGHTGPHDTVVDEVLRGSEPAANDEEGDETQD